MQVFYRALGELKQKMNPAEGVIDTEEQLDVETLLDILGIDRQDLVIMVNDRKADAGDYLHDGDRVVIIPFVVGG
ncbi:MAG: MoaD/ThiS family protein [Syntrophomonadaceae bacterium]|nr:MoaD/ThiS family protein [Syntrophomonadaceae bacterium]